MIVKCKTGHRHDTGHDWLLISDVREVSYGYIKKVSVDHTIDYTHAFPDKESKSDYALSLMCVTKDKTAVKIYCETVVYLCNEEGGTMETLTAG